METAFPWNLTLFHLINGPANPSPALLEVAKALAVLPPWGAIVLLIFCWLYGNREKQRAVMIAGLALLLGLGLNFLIGAIYYSPRPFAVGIGNNLYPHDLESSFPSDHATFLWSLGISLLLAGPLRGFGWLFVVLGLATAWARVFLGVHFPLDMAGALVTAFIAAFLSHSFAARFGGAPFRLSDAVNGWLRHYLPGGGQ
ncbi:MAG: undecaprenyl-diphosphatase [Alphaproteobacteria bacterium]|nr:MAG: undecaprenyl-diphosphatase [Alphaproteobacteria bacterium]